MYSNEFLEILPFFIMIFVIYGLFGLFGLANYVINGLGVLRISASHGIPNGWLGFVPIGMNYQVGAVAGELEFGKRRMRKTGLWLALIPLLTSVAFAAVYAIMFVYIVITAFAMDGSSLSPLIFMTPLLFITLFITLVVTVGTTVHLIVFHMAYYKIFSAHYSSAHAVFYMLLGAFVPLAIGILLMKTAKVPIINPPEYMRNPPFPPFHVQSPHAQPAELIEPPESPEPPAEPPEE